LMVLAGYGSSEEGTPVVAWDAHRSTVA
jgi:hypothetical protein